MCVVLIVMVCTTYGSLLYSNHLPSSETNAQEIPIEKFNFSACRPPPEDPGNYLQSQKSRYLLLTLSLCLVVDAGDNCITVITTGQNYTLEVGEFSYQCLSAFVGGMSCIKCYFQD